MGRNRHPAAATPVGKLHVAAQQIFAWNYTRYVETVAAGQKYWTHFGCLAGWRRIELLMFPHATNCVAQIYSSGAALA